MPELITIPVEGLDAPLAGRETATAIADLKTRFLFKDAPVVEAFLTTHSPVIPTLLSSVAYLKECFGEGTPLALEVMLEEDAPRPIYGLAIWSGTRLQAREALERFDRTWWMDVAPGVNGQVVFDYELV